MSELPKGWKTVKIPDLIGADGVFNDGDWVESKDQDPDGDVRLVQLADIGDGEFRDRSNRFMTSKKAEKLRCTFMEKGDVLVARMPDPLGRACIFPGDKKKSVTVVDVCIIRPGKDSVDPRWLMNHINAPQFRAAIDSYESGTTRKRISRKNLSRIEFPLPPLPEQRRIVARIEELFSRLDAGVAALLHAKAQLQRYRQSVLAAAVTGQLTQAWREQHPNTEPASEILERILEARKARWKGKFKEPLRPVEIENLELPELPASWEWTTLNQLTCLVKDGPHYSPKYAEEGIPFVTGGNVRPDGVDFDAAKRITPKLHEELSKRCKPELNDILYTKGGTTGIARVNTYTRDFNVWVHVAVLRLADTEATTPFFIQHMLNSPFCYRQSQEFTHGVGNQDLGLTRMIKIAVPLPPTDEQHQIVAEVEARTTAIDHLEAELDRQITRSNRLRQSTLSSAFSGTL